MEAKLLNEMIAKAMGDSQVDRYIVVDQEGEVVMAFMDGNVETAEQAKAWIDSYGTSPQQSKWQVVSQRAWPDYQNMTGHAARFINWAFAHLELDDFAVLVGMQDLPGMSVQTKLLATPSVRRLVLIN